MDTNPDQLAKVLSAENENVLKSFRRTRTFKCPAKKSVSFSWKAFFLLTLFSTFLAPLKSALLAFISFVRVMSEYRRLN